MAPIYAVTRANYSSIIAAYAEQHGQTMEQAFIEMFLSTSPYYSMQFIYYKTRLHIMKAHEESTENGVRLLREIWESY